MGYQKIGMTTLAAVAVMVVVVIWGEGVAAQSSSSSSGCTSALISMSPCLNYITGNSSTPSSGCCQQLASVVRSQPQCLCAALNGGGSSMGININQTQALALPSACNVQTLPVSRCNAATPTTSPTATTESPNTVPSNSGSGSKTVPSTDIGTSDASSTRTTISLLFSLLFIASYASIFTIY